jgi:hypothetical protein
VISEDDLILYEARDGTQTLLTDTSGQGIVRCIDGSEARVTPASVLATLAERRAVKKTKESATRKSCFLDHLDEGGESEGASVTSSSSSESDGASKPAQ